MRKILLLLTILVSCTGMLHAAEESVSFDFSQKATITGLPLSSSTTVSTWTYNGYDFSSKSCYKNTSNGYMMMSSNGYLQLPAVDGTITSVTIYVSSSCSTSATMALFKDSASGTQIGTTYTAKQNGSNTFTVSSANNSDVYFLVNGSSKNFQLTKVEINYTTSGPVGPAEPVDYTCADFTDKVLEVGTTYTLDLGTSHPDVTFTNSNATVASIDADGVITANAVGTTTITASWDAVEEAFNAGSATFNVEVTKPAPVTGYKIVFTTGTNTQTTFANIKELTAAHVSEGLQYVSTVQSQNNAFPYTAEGIRIGSASSAGNLIINLSELGQVNATKVTIHAKAHDTKDHYMNWGSAASTTAGQKVDNSDYKDYTFDLDGSKLTQLAIYTNMRVCIDYILITYELVETEPVDYTALNNLTIDDLFPGDTRQLPLGEKFPADMFMTSNNENVVTVTDEGLLTAVDAGTTTISVEWDADEVNNFTAGNAEINVTVKKPLETASMSFLHNVVYGKLGVGVVGQAAYYNGNGTIEYKSSDETILKVNPTTGMITKADVLRTGEVTITATAPETADFKAATASYTIVIEDPNANFSDLKSGEAMFDFSTKDFYGFTSTTSSNYYEKDITEITEVEPITVSFTGNYRSWLWSGYYELRLQKNSTIAIAVPDGYAITKITLNTLNNGTSYLTLTEGGGTFSSDKKTWENDSENIINSVKFTSEGGFTEMVSMTVIWKNLNSSDQKPANLSFDNLLYNDLVGTDINVNAVNNPNNVPVAYSIDNLEEGSDYTITENGENLTVNVNKTGVYTLRAKSNATDEYLPGIAILRLNVFPAVELKLNDGEAFDLTEEGEIVLPEEGGSFTIEGNYPNTVRIWYALNGSADESLYDGTPVEFTDDATLTYHLEYAETDRYRYTTNHTICVTPPAPECNVAHGEEIPADATLTFTSKEGTTLLYRVSTTLPAAYSAMRAPAATEGWDNNGTNSYSFDASELPAGTSVLVSTKALHSNGRIESAETARAFTVGSGTVTGVENIEAAADNAPVEFFNLQGIRVANPANGIYIRRQGNTVEKVTLNN